MRKHLTFLIALGAIVFAVVSPVSAQGLTLPFTGGPFRGATYQGPVDIVASPIEFWGFRCASAALATGTTKVANIVRASDSTATDIVCLTSGAFDTATASAFCASTTCVVATLYGQTAGNNMTATGTARPALTFNAIGGSKTCMTLAGAQQMAAGTSTQAQPWTVSAVAERTGAFSSTDSLFESATNDSGIVWTTSANTVATFAGSVLSATATDSAFHALQAVANSASSSVYVDGTATNGSAGTAGFSGTLRIGTGFTNLTGVVCEVGVWPTGFNSTQAGNMNTNQHSATNGYNF